MGCVSYSSAKMQSVYFTGPSRLGYLIKDNISKQIQKSDKSYFNITFLYDVEWFIFCITLEKNYGINTLICSLFFFDLTKKYTDNFYLIVEHFGLMKYTLNKLD